jgi:hypothetical protein
LNSFRIQERNNHQEQKQELRQDAQKYKGMLSELREQRLKEYSSERQSRDVTKELQNRNRGRSYDR